MSSKAMQCSFCNKREDAVRKLIASPSDPSRAYICDECVAVCNSILANDPGAPVATPVTAVIENFAQLAEFSTTKMAKVTVAYGGTLFVGLNCFEPGQEHAAHSHRGQDKLYIVLEGSAEIVVGDVMKIVLPGGGAFAPSGVLHSIRNVGETRLVVMAILAPPPHSHEPV